MKTLLCKITLAAAIALLGLNSTAWAQGSDDDGCSNKTLEGDYAFTISGQIFGLNGVPVTMRQGVAMTHFDGEGNLIQSDFDLTYPDSKGGSSQTRGTQDPTTKFNINETGTYTVNSDCTGTATFQVGATIQFMFVISDDGRNIDAVMALLTPPGASVPVPALIHSEGRKVGRIRRHRD